MLNSWDEKELYSCWNREIAACEGSTDGQSSIGKKKKKKHET